MTAYREEAPPVALAEFVECVWTLQTKAAIREYPVAPDGCVDLIFNRAEGLRVVGAMTVQRHFDVAANSESVGVRFHPGMARAALGMPVYELTDQSIPLEDLWPKRGADLLRRLEDAESLRVGLRQMLESVRPAARVRDGMRSAFEGLIVTRGEASLDELARAANLSPRQFRRRCLEESGLTPKMLARILRFRFASKLSIVSPRPDWAAIAARAGYFDQSHLIRDFRAFTGETPMSVFSKTIAG